MLIWNENALAVQNTQSQLPPLRPTQLFSFGLTSWSRVRIPCRPTTIFPCEVYMYSHLCGFPPKRDVANITSTAFFKTSFQVLCQFVTTSRPAIPLTGQNKQSQPLLGDPLSCFRPFCTQRGPSEASLFLKQCEQRVKHTVSMPFLFLSSTKPAALMENKDVKPGALFRRDALCKNCQVWKVGRRLCRARLLQRCNSRRAVREPRPPLEATLFH